MFLGARTTAAKRDTNRDQEGVSSLGCQHFRADVEVVRQVNMPELGKVLQRLREGLQARTRQSACTLIRAHAQHICQYGVASQNRLNNVPHTETFSAWIVQK